MAEPTGNMAERLATLAGKWAGAAAFGSFVVYLLGYLALRFQLTTYGVASNLDAFDEKYFFAGCRFLVFVGMAIPSILLLLALLWVLSWLPWRLVPLGLRTRLGLGLRQWASKPYRIEIVGCVLALLLIQICLRQCVLLSNLLLANALPKAWISGVLLASDSEQSLYFYALIAGTGVSAALLVGALRNRAPVDGLTHFLRGVLGLLVAIEILLLPVNFGVLIGTPWLPRVAQTSDGQQLPPGALAWLVWDSKEALVYLTCDRHDGRALITVPRKDRSVSIVRSDRVFHVLFEEASCPVAQ